jgi:lipopolysaccharide transport system ATP-binding protein
MPEAALAIELSEVSKRYRLYPSRLAMLLDFLGLQWLRIRAPRFTEHQALDRVSLKVPRGARVGVIGRNGAGKTTLLKLLTRNYQPSAGKVLVNGKVQALLTAGLGFHPELTGAQNIRTSLIYNGLAREAQVQAYVDIVAFAELGEYLHQPLKTYSLGMQSRLAFATATAVKPDVLIIDEVMGAGDAYFAAKSSERMRELTSSGLTLVLVSHSMQQIVQFCDRAVWLEQGAIAMQGETLEVVKAYEKFIRGMDDARLQRRNAAVLASRQAAPEAPRSLSAWSGVEGLRIASFRIADREGRERAVFESGDTLEYEVVISGGEGGPRPCIVAINTYLLGGALVLLDWSPAFEVAGEGRTVKLRYQPLMLGNGEYVVSIGLYKVLDMADLSSAQYYDLWDRSFQFKVRTPYPLDASLCKAPGRWTVPSR